MSFKLFDRKLVLPAVAESFRKLHPRVQLRSPVMFVVYVGSIITTRLHTRHCSVVVDHRTVCELRRSNGGRPQQGAGSLAA
jgi:high-affinity K+ transport system ATPase subunit B